MVASTSTTPVFSDSIWVDHWIRHTDSQPLNLNGTNHANQTAKLLINRHHQKKTNILYSVGNIKITSLKQLYQWQWSKHFEKSSISVP